MALTPIFTWSLQSPNGTVWVPSLTATGRLLFVSGGAVLTASPPVFQGTPSTVIWTPTISNTGQLTLTPGVASTQFHAALYDPGLVAYLLTVDADEVVRVEETVTPRKFTLKR